MGVVFAAYDPELDRKVAVKLLKPLRGDETAARQRLQREAQALAKLNHPNVVSVHDVGTHNGRVFVAMEFVEGVTLGRWMKQPRGWREVIRVFEAAGRGLAAAHHEGLIHRDFKPENVMLGTDGRARVMDFGLARHRAAEAEPPPEAGTVEPGADATLTNTGVLMGTPAYMAPEQFLGVEVTARSDQFGYCVALFEALYGTRPFQGQSLAELSLAVSNGQLTEPSSASHVPRWLYRVVVRGLAASPERRFGSMNELLLDLTQGEERRRRRFGLVGAGVCAVVAGGIWGGGQLNERRQVERCRAEGAAIEADWNDEARTRVRTGLRETGAAQAQVTVDKVMPWLEEHAQSWREAREQACTNAAVEDVWDQDTLDRSVWCLDERRYAFTALVAELSDATPETVNKAVVAASGLRPVAPCLDERYIQTTPTPPVEDRAAVVEMRVQLARVSAMTAVADYDRAQALAESNLAEAEALGWKPLVANARYQVGDVLVRRARYEEGERQLERAYFESAKSGATEEAFRAASRLTFLVGSQLQRPSEGERWSEHANVLRLQLHDPAGLREADELNHLAAVYKVKGEYEGARDLNERALRIREDALGAGHPEVATSLDNLGTVTFELGEQSVAATLHTRALNIRRKALGARHPLVAVSLSHLARLAFSKGDYDEAGEMFEQALSIREEALGPVHTDVAQIVANLATIDLMQGKYDRAALRLEQALSIQEELLGEDHPNVATVLNNLALAHYRREAFDDAVSMYERSISITKRALGPEHPSLAATLNNLALIHFEREDYDEAMTLFERALTIREKALGPDHQDTAIPLVGMAEVELARGNPRKGLDFARRTMDIFERGDPPPLSLAEAQFVLAKALDATGQSDDRVTRLVQEARAAYADRRETSSRELKEIDAWMSSRGLSAPSGEGL